MLALMLMSMLLVDPPSITHVEVIKGEIAASVVDHQVSSSDGMLLINILNGVETRIRQNNNPAAIQLLGSFKIYVNKFVTAGRVPAALGALWILQADAVILEL